MSVSLFGYLTSVRRRSCLVYKDRVFEVFINPSFIKLNQENHENFLESNKLLVEPPRLLFLFLLLLDHARHLIPPMLTSPSSHKRTLTRSSHWSSRFKSLKEDYHFLGINSRSNSPTFIMVGFIQGVTTFARSLRTFLSSVESTVQTKFCLQFLSFKIELTSTGNNTSGSQKEIVQSRSPKMSFKRFFAGLQETSAPFSTAIRLRSKKILNISYKTVKIGLHTQSTYQVY